MAAVQLSAREQIFTGIAFQCMSGKPQIDWDKFAILAGLKNGKSARDSFAPVMKKLMSVGTIGKANDAKQPITPKPISKGAGCKRKNDGNDNSDSLAPKKARKVLKSRNATVEAASDSDEDFSVKGKDEKTSFKIERPGDGEVFE